MNRFFQLLLDPRVLGVFGLAALAAFLFLGAEALQWGLTLAAIVFGLVLLTVVVAWAVRRWRARRAAQRMEQELESTLGEADRAGRGGKEGTETAVIRERLVEALKTIKTSKLGQTTGQAALYELPWYMVIGNPAAGKSTAIVQSGLHFPFARGTDNILRGIGGTRNCDWFFTSEGILIDTAGRYAVHEEDRGEWLSFLGMLKRNRPKAPINGILIAASLAELIEAKPDAVIRLAKSLRQRVQELTESLEVFAPVYVVFTKADLIPGFVDFFEDQDAKERERVWGATLAYRPEAPVDAVEQFDAHFDELQDGLRELAMARMALNRGRPLSPAVLAFPLEFAAMQNVLRSFVATLFEDNPYQYRPVFRGFYFTSAVQQGVVGDRARNGVAQRFGLGAPSGSAPAPVQTENGFFLKDLFSKVLFADRQLVRQHASKAKVRLRIATFAGGVGVLALVLAGWSWSYVGNRQLVQNVQADLDKAVKLQQGQTDLASRLQAMELLQNRVEQLDAWREGHPWSVGLGLYQGQTLERKLRSEYFHGVRELMLKPVAQAIEGYLGEVNRHAADLKPIQAVEASAQPVALSASAAQAAASAAARAAGSGTAAVAAPSRYVQASTTDVEDAYKALKTYLMLAERQRMDAGHLTDQITRFWRSWLEDNRGNLPREQMMRSAERMVSFSMANLNDPAYPVLDNNFSLVDQTRENLRRVVQGAPALERVYAEVKARASTRYPPMTVARIVGDTGKDTVLGSQVVSGTFTREAWQGYVNEAFQQAAEHELQSVDWVLKTDTRNDLSLQGSPEDIRRKLTERYKNEYVVEWQRFIQGITVADFTSFDTAVNHMNRLGDKADSPIRKLLTVLYDQTSWDNPSILNERLAKTRQGFVEWFKQSVLRMAPSRVEFKVDVAGGERGIPMGPVGREFVVLARWMDARDGGAAPIDGYLQSLSKLRTRFNQMKSQGDPGPASRELMAATLSGSGSELADALKYVDEQMFTGATDSAKATLKPMLVRPLMQSFAVLVPPAETELNRLWTAQVLQLFQQNLAGKYPFDTSSRIEASATEVARVFGPSGAVAKFASESLGPLVNRRGDAITARQWAEQGVRLRPEFVDGFPAWVAALDGAEGGAAAAPAGAAAGSAQSAFQLMPMGAPGFLEYTVEIDGQTLRYRNGTAQWASFVWPNPGGTPGVRISGVTLDNRTVEVFSAPGAYGFERLIAAAQVSKLADGVRELRWGEGRNAITLHYRAITMPGASQAAGGSGAARGKGLRGLSLPALVAGMAPAEASVAAAGVAP